MLANDTTVLQNDLIETPRGYCTRSLLYGTSLSLYYFAISSLFVCLVMSIALASFLTHSGNAIAATRAPRVHKQAAFEYYKAYEGQVEWVLIRPQSLSANQTFWVDFPAACMDYIIPGQWEVISNDAIAYIPSSPLAHQYAGQQNLESTATADYWATQAAEENESIDADWQTLEQDKARR
jgi:hypothetical protein